MASIFDDLTTAKQGESPDEAVSSQEKQSDESKQENVTQHNINPQHYTLKQIKEVCQQLLKYGLLESASKSGLYQAALTHLTKVNEILEPLDLALKIDDIRGLAFVIVADNFIDDKDDEQWSHPMVRRQRLNMEQSLMIAILRKQFVAHELEVGIGDNAAVIHLDEVLPELNAYLGELGSELREDKRLRNLLEQLKTYGIVTDINEHEQITIRPLIAHVANPENLKNLLTAIKLKANTTNEEPNS